MKPKLGQGPDPLAPRIAGALFDYLIAQPTPRRVRDAREALALSGREFGFALRTLERRGLARRFRFGSTVPVMPRLQSASLIEATKLAFSRPGRFGAGPGRTLVGA